MRVKYVASFFSARTILNYFYSPLTRVYILSVPCDGHHRQTHTTTRLLYTRSCCRYAHVFYSPYNCRETNNAWTALDPLRWKHAVFPCRVFSPSFISLMRRQRTCRCATYSVHARSMGSTEWTPWFPIADEWCLIAAISDGHLVRRRVRHFRHRFLTLPCPCRHVCFSKSIQIDCRRIINRKYVIMFWSRILIESFGYTFNFISRTCREVLKALADIQI